MRTLVLLAASTSLLAVVSAPSEAEACGAFFSSQTSAGTAIDAERALMVWRAQTVDIHVQISVETTDTDVAWILPVPSGPTLSLGDPGVFDALDAVTTPQVTLAGEEHGGGGGGGCCAVAADAAGGNLGGDTTSGVTLFESGTLGSYEYEIVSAVTVEKLTTWLTDHGYALPEGADAVLDPYVQAGMRFVAAQVSREATEDELKSLEPLVVSVDRPAGNEMTFPLALGKLSAGAFVPVLVYVLASQRYRVANYAGVELQAVADRLRAMFEADGVIDYDAAVDSLTADSGGRLAVTEFSRDLRDLEPPQALADLMDDAAFHLTRLYMRVPDEALADAIIAFAASAPEVLPEATARNTPPAPTSMTAWLLLAVLLAAAGVVRLDG